MRPRETSGILAALPVAGLLVLLLARWLPLRWQYVESPLGIVSIATLDRYPQQKETFWLFAGVALAVLLVWLLAPRLAAARVALRPGVEALGALALLAVLWLPTPMGVGVATIALAGALALAARPALPGALEPEPARDAPSALSPRGLALLTAAAVGIALLLTPTFWVSVYNVAIGLPDERRTVDGFLFQGHIGQHLAWANALAHGGFHGKDIFCLYGPLYDWGLVGSWQLFGRSIVTWDLYFAATRVLGLAALLLLGGVLMRRRAWLLVLPWLVPWVNLRSGWALLGLVLVGAWLRRGGLAWLAAAGLVGGVSLLYSQEFGLAFLVTAALVLALHRAGRAAAVFAGGVAVVVVPLLLFYAAHDALGPMLTELAGYPGYIVAGYAKVAFPALATSLPLDASAWHSQGMLALQLGYGIPAVGLAALLLALPVTGLRLNAPLASAGATLAALRADPWRTLVAATAVFGLLSFRTALGRSDVHHMVAALPAAAVLTGLACERCHALWRAGPAWRPLAAWRSAALVLFVAHSGFALTGKPLTELRDTAAWLAEPTRYAARAFGSPTVNGVTRWIRDHTDEDDTVLFLPNDGAYYYLTDRRNPIRFVMGHQIVSEAHRREVLAELRADPPPYLVWDDTALRVDGLADEKVFGPDLMQWLRESYAPVTRIGGVEIRRWRAGLREPPDS